MDYLNEKHDESSSWSQLIVSQTATTPIQLLINHSQSYPFLGDHETSIAACGLCLTFLFLSDSCNIIVTILNTEEYA